MITPASLGLPPKFKEFRSEQLRMTARAATFTNKCLMIDAPTGIGKTLIGAAVQKWMGKKVLYVVTTKQLQEQIIKDYPYAAVLKGRGTYPCLKYEGMTPPVMADMCTNSQDNSCRYFASCPYQRAKRRAESADLAVLNTAYYLTECNFIGSFSGREYVILDEFDMVEDQLMSFIELKITQRMLDRLGLDPPQYKTKFESWVEWGRQALGKVRRELASYGSISEDDLDLKDLRHKRYLENFVSKMIFFIEEVDKDWVWYPGQTEWSFKPIWVSKYAQDKLWKHADHFLGMSATILDARQIARNLGLLSDQYEYEQLDSPFPKEHRPIYYTPVANCRYAEIEQAQPKIMKEIDRILDMYPNERGIIHTVSYKLTQYITKNTRHGDRMITHSSMNRAIIIEQFKKANRPLVLVSPSAERGLDLPQEQCRFIIIAKVPYPNLGDEQIKRRTYAKGDRWYAHKTVSSIIQASGRGVRSEDDHCDTYILDSQFNRLLTDHRSFFPKWYLAAIAKKT